MAGKTWIAAVALAILVLPQGVLADTVSAASNRLCVAGSWTAVSGTPDEKPVRYETAHFAFRWKGDASENVQAAGEELERIWAVYMTKVGFTEPFCDAASKHKANVNIDPAFGLSGGPTGERDMGMWIGPLGLKDHWGLAHEFAHALQGSTRGLRGDKYSGWLWESHANWMAHQMPEFRNELHCSEMLVNYPHLYYGSTRDRYCNWQFWDYVKDVYGYKAVSDVWEKALKPDQQGFEDDDPLSVLARNQGWTISDLNDVMGMWAAHNVGWDYVDPDGYPAGLVYRAKYGNYDAREGDRLLRVTALDPIDMDKRQFHVPFAWAPQRWGYNLIRLVPDKNAARITVNFRGVVQTAPAAQSLPGLQFEPDKIVPPSSDWRWAIVALDAAGNPRYSALARGARGQQSLAIKPDDQAVFMVVMATPSLMQKIRWDQSYYSIYRYPWMAEFIGAWPEGFQPNAPHPAGHKHANGGGWVADAAHVDDSVYVGPYARVLGGTVSGNARIEDHATVVNASIGGRARIAALSILDGGVVVKDDAVIATTFKGIGAFERGTVVSGTGEILGDAEVRDGFEITKGVHYGFVDKAAAADPKQGALLTAPVPEVTAKPEFVWQP